MTESITSLILSTISLFQHSVDGADALVGPAERPAWPPFGRPAVDIEMHPGLGILDEPLQEHRRRNRPREDAGARIVHVGDLGIHHAVVGHPERHLPEWVVAGEAG